MLPCTYKRIIDEQNLFVHKRRERENERKREAHTRFSHSLRKNTIYNVKRREVLWHIHAQSLIRTDDDDFYDAMRARVFVFNFVFACNQLYVQFFILNVQQQCFLVLFLTSNYSCYTFGSTTRRTRPRRRCSSSPRPEKCPRLRRHRRSRQQTPLDSNNRRRRYCNCSTR